MLSEGPDPANLPKQTFELNLLKKKNCDPYLVCLGAIQFWIISPQFAQLSYEQKSHFDLKVGCSNFSLAQKHLVHLPYLNLPIERIILVLCIPFLYLFFPLPLIIVCNFQMFFVKACK